MVGIWTGNNYPGHPRRFNEIAGRNKADSNGGRETFHLLFMWAKKGEHKDVPPTCTRGFGGKTRRTGRHQGSGGIGPDRESVP